MYISTKHSMVPALGFDVTLLLNLFDIALIFRLQRLVPMAIRIYFVYNKWAAEERSSF